MQNNLTALWRYMYHMYQLDAFTQSCPADQDIINHYKLQQVTARKYICSMISIALNFNLKSIILSPFSLFYFYFSDFWCSIYIRLVKCKFCRLREISRYDRWNWCSYYESIQLEIAFAPFHRVSFIMKNFPSLTPSDLEFFSHYS